MYKLIEGSGAVMHLTGGMYIPDHSGNRHYQEYLAWIEAGNIPIPAYTEEEELESLSKSERDWRNTELARADIQLLKVQDGMTGLGTQKAWREYRVALRDWPSHKNFPAIRPAAPDGKA